MNIIYVYLAGIIICFIGFIAMIVVSITSKKKKPKSSSTSKTILDILPKMCYEEKYDCFVKEDGSCTDILQVETKDLLNASESTTMYDKLRWRRLYIKYPSDLKIIAMNFPSNTEKQQEYMRHKMNTTKNKVYKKWLHKKINELVWLETHRMNREFFLMFWGENTDKLMQNRQTIIDALGVGKNGLIQRISEEKRTLIFYKLNNKASYVIPKNIKQGED